MHDDDGTFFRICVLPEKLAKETPKMDSACVKYHIGAVGVLIPQNRRDFRDKSNGTSPGTCKQVKTMKNIGLASPNTYISHKVLLNLFRQ